MMMNNTMMNQCNVAPGTIIFGKWNKYQYKVIKKLGAGANGIVYLTEYDRQVVALKISDNVANIASEMNVLKSFSKVQGFSLGPYLLHGDDWIRNGENMPFYVMEYIEGDDLLSFIKRKGEEWIEVLMLQLLTDLGHLHDNGWIFGDLKPENLIVTLPSHKIRCVDVGGTTLIGRSVKEFTEFFDRGYWGLGSRRADPAYDLFAVAMIFINTYYPQRFQKKADSMNQLVEIIEKTKGLNPYKSVLQKALMGKFTNAKEMRSSLLQAIRLKSTNSRNYTKVNKNSNSNTTPSRTAYVKKKKKGGFGETVLILLLVCCLYGLYLYTQITG